MTNSSDTPMTNPPVKSFLDYVVEYNAEKSDFDNIKEILMSEIDENDLNGDAITQELVILYYAAHGKHRNETRIWAEYCKWCEHSQNIEDRVEDSDIAEILQKFESYDLNIVSQKVIESDPNDLCFDLLEIVMKFTNKESKKETFVQFFGEYDTEKGISFSFHTEFCEVFPKKKMVIIYE